MLDDTLRERLLKERDLDLGRALEMCRIYEAATEQIKNISNTEEMNIIKPVESIYQSNYNIKFLLENYKDVFEGMGELPCLNKISIDANAIPKVQAIRKVPFSLHEMFDKELQRMKRMGIIQEVDGPTEWVNSFTLVKKPNGQLRICLDPTELNKVINREHFQLPTLDEILPKLKNAKYFSKRIKEYFEDIEGTEMYFDDFLVFGASLEEHNNNLEKVLKRARDINLKFNKEKSQFLKTEIKYLGHILTSNGYRPYEEKVRAIKEMPVLKNKQNLERCLGMITYLGRFIPNLSTLTAVLRNLLKKICPLELE
ncbi:K02A2.6-like [Cordylochernes scorpioides]|uniref:K02A2.6-like n=1 Tax=Cordylochernes scorpioides TaxID=51811 RepID=A0ABY6KT30_9ARAC|nr:K02A2.6-like [Cordylochernes scorpioides]